jgi:uncharacterized RDD family membrane protein YckC
MNFAPVTPPGSSLVCAGVFRRFAAAWFDGFAGITLSFACIPLLERAFLHRTLLPIVLSNVFQTALLVFLVVRYGATPGYFVARVRVVGPSGSFPGFGRALLRCVPAIFGAVVGSLQMYEAIQAIPPLVATPSFADLARIMQEHGHAHPKLEHAVMAFQIVDIGAVLLNRERRAVHDFLAGTYVITLESWKEREARASA